MIFVVPVYMGHPVLLHTYFMCALKVWITDDDIDAGYFPVPWVYPIVMLALKWN